MLRAIETFCGRHKMRTTTFGRLFWGDSALVASMRHGSAKLNDAEARELRRVMDDYDATGQARIASKKRLCRRRHAAAHDDDAVPGLFKADREHREACRRGSEELEWRIRKLLGAPQRPELIAARAARKGVGA